MSKESSLVLSVRHLSTSFRTTHGNVRPVDRISFDVASGKTLCIVGESGCGKSVTAMSIMRLLPPGNSHIEAESLCFEGQELLSLRPQAMRQLRGDRMAMIFQEPMTALNPVYTVGQQIAEVFRLHRQLSRRASMQRALEMLDIVRIADPDQILNQHPHQLSGGMRQRVMIAMALACHPSLLIADEPTTALDVTVQAQVLGLMQQLQRELGTSIIFITHDLGVVAEMADEVLVMYAGHIVERGSVYTIFDAPQHPYTHALQQSVPKLTDSKQHPLTVIDGMVPSVSDFPSGCRFAARCPRAQDICTQAQPPLEGNQDHAVACYFPHAAPLQSHYEEHSA